jgi:hypothetical protein
MISGGWIISHRCSWITVYVLCCNSQVNLIVILMTYTCIAWILYYVNCPTVICLPSMLFIFIERHFLWTVDPGPFNYIHITVYFLQALFNFSQITIFYHTIHIIHCLQQTGDIDNLTASWGKVLWLCSVTSQDFIKFWGKLFVLFCMYWLKFHKDLKLFRSI